MTAAVGRMYLTKEAALRALIHKMSLQPNFRPRGYKHGQSGVTQAEKYLEDVKEVLKDFKTEGDC